jgi:hypothetical protein
VRNLKILTSTRNISSETTEIMLSVRCVFMEQIASNKHVTGIWYVCTPVYNFHLWNYSRRFELKYCDRFDGTSDMNAATQRIRRPSLGNDSVNSA